MQPASLRHAQPHAGPGPRQVCVWLLFALALCRPLPVRADVGTQLVVPVADNGQIFDGIVTALAQDRQGFVWIGTQYGLLRYDGYHYRRFAVRGPDNGPTSGVFVRRLWVAPDGRLWVGTNSDGAAVFDPRTERFTLFLPVPGDPGHLSSGRVDAFAADGRGGVWIGSNDGLYHWSPGAKALEREGAKGSLAGAPSDPHVRSLLLDAHKTLWVGTWDGLSRLRPGSRRFARAGATEAGRMLLAKQEIWALIQDKAGRVWWGSRALGAGWVDPASGRIHRLPAGAPDGLDYPWVSGFALAQDGALWVATYGGGIDLVDPATARIIRRFHHHDGVDSTLASNVIGALLADRSGLMWVGNWGGGLQRVNTGNRAFRMLRHIPGDPRSLSMENVYALLQADDGRVWVGTDGNGIDILDLSTGVVGGIRPDPGDPHGLPDGHVIALAESVDGTIWIGTRQAGLLSYDRASKRFTRWPTRLGNNGYAQIQHLLVAPDGHLWIGTNGGLLELDPKTGKTRDFTTRDKPDVAFGGSITPMAMTRDGTLWAGTDTGLYALPPGARRLVTILSRPGQAHSLSGNDVNGLVVDKQGDLLVATARGLDRLTSWDGSTARFESINARLGIPPGAMAANLALDDRGRIWDVGVVIDLAANTRTLFTRADGFDIGGGWIGAYARTRDGRLLFGGPHGVLIVRPDAFRPWHGRPPVVISSLQVDGKPLPAAGAGRLSLVPGTHGFSVEFAALDYSDPDALRYAYRLEGYESAWTEVPAERRIATFTNLDPGRYTLRIKATNREDEWSPHQLAIPVDVEPAYYETLWFRVLMVLLVLLGLYCVYLVRIRQLAARARRLETLVHERTASLAKANAELAKLAQTDALTGLPNRRAFLEAAGKEIVRMHRSGRPFAIALGDIDLFKSINDNHGHEAGDAVLQRLASTLCSGVRTQDTVARWGGEEMIFLLPETKIEAACIVAEKCRRAVEAAEIPTGDSILRVTMTFGISEFRPDESIDQCIGRADKALYAGKKAGRNRVVSGAGEDSRDREAEQP